MPKTYKIPDLLAPKYQGCGHALAAVRGGEIVDFVYLRDALESFDPDAPHAAFAAIQDERLGATVRRLQALGEVSVGMMSCWEFVVL
jgi:hypothetical protein